MSKKYSDKKVDSLMSTNLPQAEVITSLTDGLSIKWKHDFYGCDIKNYEQWFHIVLITEPLDKSNSTITYMNYHLHTGNTHTNLPSTLHSRNVQKKHIINRNKYYHNLVNVVEKNTINIICIGVRTAPPKIRTFESNYGDNLEQHMT